MSLRAVIFIRLDRPHPDKQEAICLQHADRQAFHVVALCYVASGCVALVKADGADVVIAATGDDLDHLGDEVTGAGGVMSIVRDRSRLRREIGDLVRRMLGKGMDTRDIADVLDVSTGEIRREAMWLTAHRPGRGRDRGGR